MGENQIWVGSSYIFTTMFNTDKYAHAQVTKHEVMPVSYSYGYDVTPSS